MPVEKIGGNWLSPDDVQDGDMLFVKQKPELTETQWPVRPGSEEKKKLYQIQVQLPDGALKDVTLNKTSSNNLLKVFGSNEDDWLDKPIIVERRFQKVRGEDRYVLYFKAEKMVQRELPRKKLGSTEEKLTLEEAQEKVKDWPKDVADSFIEHLKNMGRLAEGP